MFLNLLGSNLIVEFLQLDSSSCFDSKTVAVFIFLITVSVVAFLAFLSCFFFLLAMTALTT